MDINDIVSTDYEEFTPEATVSKLVGRLEDPTVPGAVVRDDDYRGVVTRRQIATSNHHPEEKVESLVQHVARLAPEDDVRQAARLMMDGETRILPVFDGREMTGVVTADDVLRAVEQFLDAATVREVYTEELVSVEPGSTLGQAVHLMREHRITHLPVLEDSTATGILSIYDLAPLTIGTATRSQGGDPGGTDSFGGPVSKNAARTHGGFGAREGDADRLLDLPVRDFMTSPVRTIAPGDTLERAVEEMFAVEGSSLVVTANGEPDGILTKTDVLDALTWETDDTRAVQLYGADLLDDLGYDDVVAMVDRFDERDGDTTVLDARVHLHEHDETMRGTPLLLARVRLYTDRGLYIASGEGYGASHALEEARDRIERQMRDDRTKRNEHPSQAFWESRFGSPTGE